MTPCRSLQVGAPSDRQQYIHRIGRTARAGRGGHGVLLLADFEAYFERLVKDMPLQRVAIAAADVDAYDRAIEQAIQRVDVKTREMAYQACARAPLCSCRGALALIVSPCLQAWLGYYNSQRHLAWSKAELVQRANWFATHRFGLGLRSPPALLKKTVGKMGLKGVPGLVLAA